MKPAVLAAAALAALAAPGVRWAPASGGGTARAGSLGGGGGGGGGIAGGGIGGGIGGGDHDWYLRAPDCEDASDVVGLRRCTRFAAWAGNLEYPHLIIEGGAVIRRFPSLLDHQIGSVTHGAESFTYRVVRPTGSRPIDTAVLSTLRGSVGLSRAVYGGIEVDLGGVTQPGDAATEMMTTGAFGSPELRQDRGFQVDSLAIVGVHAAAGFGGVGAELAGGVRAVSYRFESSYHDCQQSTSVTALGPVGEARARGELWLSPWLAAGAMIGTSVLERGAWMAGIYLGAHSRAFGGDR